MFQNVGNTVTKILYVAKSEQDKLRQAKFKFWTYLHDLVGQQINPKLRNIPFEETQNIARFLVTTYNNDANPGYLTKVDCWEHGCNLK